MAHTADEPNDTATRVGGYIGTIIAALCYLMVVWLIGRTVF